MSKHMVICAACGKRFNANRGYGYDPASRRYTCPFCRKRQKQAEKLHQADEREARTGMRQSTGAMISKIAIGALFIIVGIARAAEKGGGFLTTALVIGLALIAWGFLPWYKVREAQANEAVRLAVERRMEEAEKNDGEEDGVASELDANP